MRVLIACEESQTICKAFRQRGHIAFSADLQDCSGGHPEWHIKGDCRILLDHKPVCFDTVDGTHHVIDEWDLLIAHPPCQYISKAAGMMHSKRFYSDVDIAARTMKRLDALDFFMFFVNCQDMVEHICIENPIGCINTVYRQPDQIIQPYYFTSSLDDENQHRKTTCLWLYNLPPLVYNPFYTGVPKERCWTEHCTSAKQRAKTFPGVARAMACQWGGDPDDYLLEWMTDDNIFIDDGEFYEQETF